MTSRLQSPCGPRYHGPDELSVAATFYQIMQKLLPLLAALMLVVSLGVCALARPDRVVVGYSATWRDPNTPPDCYNYDALTHLARAFLVAHPDGTIEVPDGYFNKTMESLARQHGVKLLMSLGGEASNANNWLSIARNPKYFQHFGDNLEKLLTDHGYDGIDIDWEPSAVTTEDGLAYVSFLKGLRARFPDRIITTALGASEYWIGHFSWKDVADNVDYVNVMTYDYSGGWGGRAAYASGLYPAGAYSPEPNLSVEEGMKNLIENHKVPPAKLLMGMTFWPSRFSVNHIGDRFPIDGPGYSMNITYAQTMCLLRTGKYIDSWDEKAAMPYMERTGGGSVVVYESPRSVRLKCEYAAKLGCAGIMIWHLGADVYGDKAPLMDAVAESCGAAKEVFPRQIVELQISGLQNQELQLKARLRLAAGATDDNFAGQSISGMSALSADQLQALRVNVETRWASLQDRVWREDAPQRRNK
jgi:chitinase